MVEIVRGPWGNAASLERCLERAGIPFREVRDPDGLSMACPVILPGVASFAGIAAPLRESGMAGALLEAVGRGVPLLGICAGMQVLFDSSPESPGAAGLGIIEGPILRFGEGKVPLTGWNRIAPVGPGPEGGWAYFINSYHAVPARESCWLFESDYHGRFCAGARLGGVWGFQFHPEKSGVYGAGLMRWWYGCSQGG